jgi:hypothetical protein
MFIIVFIVMFGYALIVYQSNSKRLENIRQTNLITSLPFLLIDMCGQEIVHF